MKSLPVLHCTETAASKSAQVFFQGNWYLSPAELVPAFIASGLVVVEKKEQSSKFQQRRNSDKMKMVARGKFIRVELKN
ncbi:hypothetical protein RBA41_31100 [Massilia sp. CCM 9210]|uniref:hypothetical protein n=1 Tax=Massilia scottii TaxID=3057166 RepID=UPI002796D826|nr:hypothetical protein [Massilia sp. CCM 9210]MDQ1817757.1 hypothetical protein [Massilia sp. CCM 9210]